MQLPLIYEEPNTVFDLISHFEIASHFTRKASLKPGEMEAQESYCFTPAHLLFLLCKQAFTLHSLSSHSTSNHFPQWYQS